MRDAERDVKRRGAARRGDAQRVRTVHPSAGMPAKVLGILLLCALEFVLVFAGGLGYWRQDRQQSQMTRTSELNNAMSAGACDVVEVLCSGNTPRLDRETTNLRYMVLRKGTGGELTTVLDTREKGESYLEKGTFWCEWTDQGVLYIPDEQLEQMSEEEQTSGNLYQVQVRLVTPFTAQDEASAVVTDYGVTERLGEWLLPVTVVAGILSVLVLCWELSVAGRRSGERGVFLIWLDRIPFDVLTLLTAGLAALAGFLTLTALRSSVQLDGVVATLWFLYWPLLGVSLLLLAWLESLARRVKAHILWRNTVLFRIGRALGLLPALGVRLFWGVLAIAVQMVFWVTFNGYVSWIGQLYMVLSILVIRHLARISWMQAQLSEATARIREGSADAQIPEETLERLSGRYRRQAEDLNQIDEGVQRAVDERMKSEWLRTELITNVSHDIRTPLTSIISYVDLLRKPHTPQQEQEYLDILARQSRRLQRLTEDVLESSLADSGNIAVHLQRVQVAEIVEQSLAEYEEKLSAAGLHTVVRVPADLCVRADGRLLWRVLRNLFSNAARYSAPDSRVYVDAQARGGQVCIAIRNISREQLGIPPEELMERFVRGDSSRHSEGSGLGLDIASSLSRLMGGELVIGIDGDLFRAEVLLARAGQKSAPQGTAEERGEDREGTGGEAGRRAGSGSGRAEGKKRGQEESGSSRRAAGVPLRMPGGKRAMSRRREKKK